MKMFISIIKQSIIGILVILIPSIIVAQQVELLLYGGDDHDVFLGCLNCGKYDANSVWNAYGTYGSQYSSLSIWNRYGTYGSRYNSLSPWNKYSTNAPVVVDKEDNFYGYFSANKYHAKRTNIEFLVTILDNYEWIIEHLDEVRQEM